jgi:hypothetical protein
VDAPLNRLDRICDLEVPARGFFRVGKKSVGGVLHAAALSSISAPRATILVRVVGQRPLPRLGFVLGARATKY